MPISAEKSKVIRNCESHRRTLGQACFVKHIVVDCKEQLKPTNQRLRSMATKSSSPGPNPTKATPAKQTRSRKAAPPIARVRPQPRARTARPGDRSRNRSTRRFTIRSRTARRRLRFIWTTTAIHSTV